LVDRTTLVAIAVAVGVLVAGTLVVVVAANGRCGRSALAFPPCPGVGPSGPSPSGPLVPLVIAPQSLNDTMVSFMEGSLAQHLRSADTIMLSSGASDTGTAANPDQLATWQAELGPRLPAGVSFEARTSGLVNVERLSGNLSHAFRGIVYDYEPGFEPEFSTNFTAAQQAFQNFSRIAHAGGFRAFGYPYSAPLWSSAYQDDRWNYGTLYATTGIDADQIQLQGAAHQSGTIWQSAIQSLVAEYRAYGFPPSAISVQLTLAAGDPNNISVDAAASDYEYAVANGVGQVILWWNAASEGALLSLLGMIRG
jgi:hypothetical protein